MEKSSQSLVSTHRQEIANGERFSFGDNWVSFLKELDNERIERAVESLQDMLDVKSLKGKSFLDIGSGSGLFSLAARKMGARVHSFDYDPQSVACTRELRQRYFPGDSEWVIEEGSVLDQSYLAALGKFDIVYSWGVLHHTGAMWDALRNVEENVAEGGKLFIALYNDQGWVSRAWARLKKAYVSLPKGLRFLVLIPCLIRIWGPVTIKDVLSGRPFGAWKEYKKFRGMSPMRDVIDWAGGYPFEVSTPGEIFEFYKARNYSLEKLKTCAGGHGCNEFVFLRKAA